MCKTALSILFASVMSNGAMADVVRHGSFPEFYWGMWVATGSDRSVIELSAKTYVSSEANCSVNSVSQTAGVSSSIYSAHLQCVSRAETAGQRFAANLIIWPKGDDQIAVGPDFMHLSIFRRCVATHPMPIGSSHSEDLSFDEPLPGSQGECRTDGKDSRATCHDPDHAFTDRRPVSVGMDMLVTKFERPAKCGPV